MQIILLMLENIQRKKLLIHLSILVWSEIFSIVKLDTQYET